MFFNSLGIAEYKIKMYICISFKNKGIMKAKIKDIKEAAKIATESIKLGRGNSTFSERVEDMLKSYSNIYKNGLDYVIRLQNGTYKSIWEYID